MGPRGCFLITAALICLSTVTTGEGASWKRVRDENGIQLYSIESSERAINKVKVSAVIEANIARIVAALDDVGRYTSWVPYMKEARVLERYSENELLTYSLFDAPWPVRDRDYVYSVRIERQTNRVIYTMQTESSGLMPEQRDVVRAVLLESRYELEALDNNRTRMELIFHIDPRGSLPVWIINIVHEVLPFEAVKEFRNQMRRDEQR